MNFWGKITNKIRDWTQKKTLVPACVVGVLLLFVPLGSLKANIPHETPDVSRFLPPEEPNLKKISRQLKKLPSGNLTAGEIFSDTLNSLNEINRNAVETAADILGVEIAFLPPPHDAPAGRLEEQTKIAKPKPSAKKTHKPAQVKASAPNPKASYATQTSSLGKSMDSSPSNGFWTSYFHDGLAGVNFFTLRQQGERSLHGAMLIYEKPMQAQSLAWLPHFLPASDARLNIMRGHIRIGHKPLVWISTPSIMRHNNVEVQFLSRLGQGKDHPANTGECRCTNARDLSTLGQIFVARAHAVSLSDVVLLSGERDTGIHTTVLF